MKRRVNYTIEEGVLERLEEYLEKNAKITGKTPSRSSIVEEALSKYLFHLEKELRELEVPKELSVVR